MGQSTTSMKSPSSSSAQPQAPPVPVNPSAVMSFSLFGGSVPMRFTVVPTTPTGLVGIPMRLLWTLHNDSNPGDESPDHDQSTAAAATPGQTVYFSEGGDYRNAAGRSLAYKLAIYRWKLDGEPAVEEEGEECEGTPVGVDLSRSDENWELIPDRFPNLMCLGGIIHAAQAKPGESWSTNLLLSKWVIIDRPGTYIVRCQRSTVFSLDSDVYQHHDFDPEHSENARCEMVQLNATARFVVEEAASEEAFADALGEIMRVALDDADYDSSTEALALLGHVQSHLVIEFWGGIIERRDMRRFSEAVRALRQFDSEKAVAFICRGFDVQFEDVRPRCTTDDLARGSIGSYRHSAAVALSQSPHESSLDRLYELGNGSEYHNVRLTLLHAEAKSGTLRSWELMQRYRKDSEEIIRREAKRYMKAYKGPKE